jgi:hypothetical protein
MPDKRPYIRHARQAYSLLNGLAHRPGDRAYALALHTARQIVSFYEHYSLPQPPASDSLVYRDAHAAQNVDDYDSLDAFADSDIIGVSVMTPQRDEAQRLALTLRCSSPAGRLHAGRAGVDHDAAWAGLSDGVQVLRGRAHADPVDVAGQRRG